MSRQVSQQNEPGMAQYIDLAADQVEAVATALREQELSQLLETADRVARRQPALFLAAAFAVGFAATRFLTSSAAAQEGQ
jgi:hypothetical protein